MTKPFIGSEALAGGLLNRHQLRTRFAAVCPDVYLSKQIEPSLWDRTTAAWLWSHRQGVVAGLSAAAMHGAKWIAHDAPVELIHANPRHPAGVRTRRCLLLDDETEVIRGIRVTTPARTAFDLARRGQVDEAVARIDALIQATKLTIADVADTAARHPGVRGLRQLETVLELADGGAQSPRETALRLLLIRNGFPVPETQIEVLADTGRPLAFLGWIIVRVVAEDRPADILRRVRRALDLRTELADADRRAALSP